MRLRTTPDRARAVTPTRSAPGGADTTEATTPFRRTLLPARQTCSKSRLDDNVPGPTDLVRAYADSFARPFDRRAFKIARPARVRMRARNPCLRLRRRLFG